MIFHICVGQEIGKNAQQTIPTQCIQVLIPQKQPLPQAHCDCKTSPNRVLQSLLKREVFHDQLRKSIQFLTLWMFQNEKK